MLTINARNVNEALPVAIMHLKSHGVEISPRGMKTLEYPDPVTTVYKSPMERVLFSPLRNANPYFHFMEALWMLAGRNDVQWLSQFNSGMKQFSDDGSTFHGAYGFRLRKTHGDQLQLIVDMLKRDPDTRRAVASIWNTPDDLGTDSKDIPCNDLLFFKIREGKLNMTVCNRSNDVLWGAYGSNVVHFSMFQEYVAGCLGVEVGKYRQISDSFHVYLDDASHKLWDNLKKDGITFQDPYSEETVEPYPMFHAVDSNYSENWDIAVNRFIETPDAVVTDIPFFNDVARQMYLSHKMYKMNDLEAALGYAGYIKASDWRLACTQWLERIIERRKENAR